MANTYSKAKGRGIGRYIAIPHCVLTSERGMGLTGPELKLLAHLLLQYNGGNNGGMSPTFSLMKNFGWTSTGALYKARQGLEHKGFIVITKVGRKIRGDCTLVAVTWLGIDASEKWEYGSHISKSRSPLNYYKFPIEDWKIQPSSKPP